MAIGVVICKVATTLPTLLTKLQLLTVNFAPLCSIERNVASLVSSPQKSDWLAGTGTFCMVTAGIPTPMADPVTVRVPVPLVPVPVVLPVPLVPPVPVVPEDAMMALASKVMLYAETADSAVLNAD